MKSWREIKDDIQRKYVEEAIADVVADPALISAQGHDTYFINGDPRLPGKRILRIAAEKQFPGEEFDWNGAGGTGGTIDILKNMGYTVKAQGEEVKNVTEWFISGNPKKYDLVNAFKDLGTVDWKQSTNVAAGDIVYIYVSEGYQAVKYKCRANKVDLKEPDIDDSKYNVSGEYDGTYGRYMELELLEELKGSAFGRVLMERHGFGTPQSPVRVNLNTREYMNIIQELQHEAEMDPDKHDGSYELARETVRAYKNMGNLSSIDFKDLNLIYHMVIGTWRQKVEIKKKSITESHLPENEKSRLTALLDKVWENAKNNMYSNHEGDASIGMFGTAFYSFYDASQEDVKRFIKMLVDILDVESDDEIFDICQKGLNGGIAGMQAASASVILHCLKPFTFPVFNSNSGNPNIYIYFGVDVVKVSDLGNYIENCKKVKAYRDENFTVKNYRIYDLAARKLGKGDKEYEPVDFERIIAYLRDYAGQHYVAVEKAGDEREKMEAFKEEGGKAREEYTKFCAHVKNAFPELEAQSTSGWINQGNNTQRYFWVELKHKDWKNYPHSISISLNDKSLTDEDWVLSVRVETRDGSSKAEDYKRHNVIADLALPEGSDAYYAYSDKNGNYFLAEDGQQEAIQLRDSGKLQKVQIIQRISKPYEYTRTTEIVKETQDAVRFLMPYYKYIFEKAGITDGPVEWWPSKDEYDPGITMEQWVEILNDHEITTDNNLRMFAEWIDYGRPAACSEIADHYGETKNFFNAGSSAMAKRIVDRGKCTQPPFRDDENARWWPVLYLGRKAGKDEIGSYIWKLRDELKAALEQIELPVVEEKTEMAGKKEFGLNTILYGPPGTGKTYNTVKYAVAICDGKSVDELTDYDAALKRYKELKKEGRIAFTTFHQSYGYEEFIEGIKPVLASDSDGSSKEVKYDVFPGIFKSFCDDAKKKKVETDAFDVSSSAMVWKVTVRSEAREDCFENNRVRIDYGMSSDGAAGFVNDMAKGDLVITTDGSRSRINGIAVLTGDDAYELDADADKTTRDVKWLAKNIDEEIVDINAGKILHRMTVARVPNMGVDDLITLAQKKGSELATTTIEENTDPYVFIIDEINRGNISKIFGELITLIEVTKRAGAKEEMETTLPYSGVPFSVPKNVYILGTMNTADRSIALMDTALRRRFDFEEMMPDTKVIEGITVSADGETLDVAKMLDAINRRIEYLYDREHTIGHAFFTRLRDNNSMECLADIFKNNVVPLLQEYFYEDYEKIQLVLGDNDKSSDDYKFILDKKVNENDIFKKSPQLDLHEKTYEIQKDAFDLIQSYIEITEARKAED